MRDLVLTDNAENRLRQRGYRGTDIDLLLQAATRIADDAFFLSDKDVTREIEQRRREIQQLERLRGTRLVVDGRKVVTLDHAGRKPARIDRARRWEDA